MAIFDSTKVHYLTYYVHLTSAEEIAEHEAALVMPSGLVRTYNLAPKGEAEARFNAPFRGFDEAAAGAAPFIWTPFSKDDASISFLDLGAGLLLIPIRTGRLPA